MNKVTIIASAIAASQAVADPSEIAASFSEIYEKSTCSLFLESMSHSPQDIAEQEHSAFMIGMVAGAAARDAKPDFPFEFSFKGNLAIALAACLVDQNEKLGNALRRD